MRRIDPRWFLLTAACSMGCHSGASEDPPSRARIGGPIVDFPRSEVDEGPEPEQSEQSPPPTVQVPEDMSDHEAPDLGADPTTPGASAGGANGGASNALDAGRSTEADAELDAGAPAPTEDASADADSGATR